MMAFERGAKRQVKTLKNGENVGLALAYDCTFIDGAVEAFRPFSNVVVSGILKYNMYDSEEIESYVKVIGRDAILQYRIS